MLEKRKDEWGQDVRVIGISVDTDKSSLKIHVKRKGMDKIEHFWRSTSTCSKDYVVSGIPHLMIIDKAGKIVFKGHPLMRPNLEEDLDILRKDGTISGEGCIAELPKPDANGYVPLP